jgi:cyclic lactone autoinducer peptide
MTNGGGNMKKLLVLALNVLGILTIAAAPVFASTQSLFYSNQPECPKELLK